MEIEELKYTLDPEHIVTEPREIRLGRRDLSRMLVVDRSHKKQIDSYVLNLSDFFDPGDVLVLNNSKRVPGILKGHVVFNDAQIELIFVSLGDDNVALCRIYPSHHISVGTKMKFNNDTLVVTGENISSNKLFEVKAISSGLKDMLKRNGSAINTVYSSKSWSVDHLNPFHSTIEGSVESPLAGLHFTPELIETLQKKGVIVTYVTLHSFGSWLPFRSDNIDEHVIQGEQFEMSEETAIVINKAKATGKKITACGSTAMRTIETCGNDAGVVTAQTGVSKLYIKPGYVFKIANHYFTNFHQYRTSLMVLDAAFCGKELLLESYEEAKKRGYFFYEYGDAIFYL